MATKNEIREKIKYTNWSELRSRIGSGTVFNIPYQVDFMTIGLAIANDDETTLRHFMNINALRPPTETQVEKWDLLPEKAFQYLIIDRYVLIQEVIQKKY